MITRRQLEAYLRERDWSKMDWRLRNHFWLNGSDDAFEFLTQNVKTLRQKASVVSDIDGQILCARNCSC